MIQTGFDTRVKIQQVIENQLPEFLLSESPKAAEFLKQYYISQEYQGGTVDIAENLDQYLKLDNLTPEVISGSTNLSAGISSTSSSINVSSTKGFPQQYGLLKIDDEIITYTGITTNSFTGCIRGFSGITSYHSQLNPEELVFSTSKAASHSNNTSVQNLSSLFLKEFYKKIKYTFTPGLENVDFTPNLDVSNFIKQSRNFYQSKGTEESFRILFNVLFGENPKIINLEDYLIKPSSSNYVRRRVIIAERISGDPTKLVGQTVRKSTDPTSQASVSEVEILTRKNKTFYKVSLFIGYNDVDLIQGTFSVSGKTRSIDSVSVGSSIISVDSTIGFGQTGTLVSGNNVFTYTDKSIDQFFGCSGISTTINVADDIRSEETLYGYEDGDTNKRVDLRITGVLSNFIANSDIYLTNEGETITVNNLGEIVNNPETNKTYKEIFFNSWIYNTSSRYQVSNISGSTFVLISKIDKSSLKVNDYVDVLVRGTQNIVVSNALVKTINTSNGQITLDNLSGFTPVVGLEYDIRRKLNKSNSSGVKIKYGNNKLVSDIQNVYNENDKFAYVASNSLPSYTITKLPSRASIDYANGSFLQGYNQETLKYSIISFSTNVPFVNGDAVVYLPQSTEMSGLVSGQTYYVQVLALKNQIRLYSSRSFLGTSDYLEFGNLSTSSGSHTFILANQKDNEIGPQKLLKKFPLIQNFETGFGDKTKTGPVGMFVNGVEVINSKSDDKIYYGPLTKFTILNSGHNYDVMNPPKVSISAGAGITAQVSPVVSGIVTAVLVDPQDFDIEKVISVTVTGGNGKGAVLEPSLLKRYREVEFDARQSTQGGGVDISNDTITFTTNHNFKNGEAIVYDKNGNDELGIGTYLGSNTNQNKTLINRSIYYAQIVNNSSIKLYPTLDSYVSGINTVGFTTTSTQGTHKFRTLEKNTLGSVKVINSGSGYQNRKLYVKSSGISTQFSTVTFTDHNFNNGEIVEYTSTGSLISGLSTSYRYQIIKLDSNTFKLANAGIGGTDASNFNRNNFVNFSSTGSGYHIFKYPDITVNVNVAYGTSSIGVITATPVVRGGIVDAYLYESGTGYGSNILNLEKKPLITLKTGKNAQLKPIISNGRISKVEIQSGGSEYYSTPDLVVEGNGVGAVLRPVVVNQKISSVVVINPGIGYSQATTKIKVQSSGSDAIFDVSIRGLTVNNQYRSSNEILTGTTEELKYGIVGYSTNIGSSTFGDTGISHSPIIGWAYDGNPIYGPYGYSNYGDENSQIKIMQTGYQSSLSNIVDRPSGFDLGFFIEDYTFNDSGDLDIHNGRFCKTPEFANGVYAYFAGITTDPGTGNLIPKFPYFVGDSFRSLIISENFLINQTFDFNNSNLIRNTFPYKVNDEYADNDFIIESNEIIKQTAKVESVTKGSVSSIDITQSGSGYRVGDLAVFDNTNTNGGGLSAVVSSITGKPIYNIATQVEKYENVVFIRKSDTEVIGYITPYHTFLSDDNVVISGLSTFVSGLSKQHNIGVTTEQVILFQDLPANAVSGVVTDISVSRIANSISVGSTIGIGTEYLSVLNIFNEDNILRVRRGVVGAAHTTSTIVNILPNKFNIPLQSQYFNSTLNDIVYFNPIQSVGLGTGVGIGVSLSYKVGIRTDLVSVPTQSIYLPNHPFKTGQSVTLTKPSSASSFVVLQTSSGSTFNLPSTGDSQTVYIINKSKDYIGITTTVGLTTNTNGLFFASNGTDNYEYSLQSNFDQVTGIVQRIRSTVAVTTSHNLRNGDSITLQVESGLSVGIGTSNAVRVKYNQIYDKLLVNPIGFNSTAIDTVKNRIIIPNHSLKTGDKIFYNSSDLIASGLSTSAYYVYRVDDNIIQLTQTYSDSFASPPVIVSLGSTGGSLQEIALINPQLPVVKNGDLVFNISDSSLQNYKLKIYYDQAFNNEFVSVGNTSTFSLSGFGTAGISTNASLTIKNSANFPSKLYYALEKSGYISTSDTDVKGYSQILFVDSGYNGTYSISGIGSTTFNISLANTPERLFYSSTDCDVLKYSTTSPTEQGGVNKMNIVFGGSNYKKLPKFVSIASSDGKDANLIPKSTTIGRINNVRIVDQGFEYSSDRTLRPEAYISPTISIKDSDTVSNVNVVFGGRNYASAPNLVLFNPQTNEIIDDQSLTCNLLSNSIGSVNIEVKPYGLSPVQHKVYSLNNTNGVGIISATASTTGIVTCLLTTPIAGFTTNVFSIGDKIFVEGIEKYSTTGTGFNSKDYNFEFFTVTNYQNTNPAQVEFNLAGFTTNPGIAKTVQSNFPTIVKYEDYPQFEVIQSPTTFSIGEKLLSNKGSGFVERNLSITDATTDYIKVFGSYTLNENELIKGKTSGVIATIESITFNRGRFDTDYATLQTYGWVDNTGKISENYQVLPDNDYYQNLSYSVRSTQTFDTLINPVNRLVHTSGLKNFSDTEVKSRSSVSYASTTVDVIVLDIIDENRIDTVNNYDLTLDVDVSSNKSKFLKLRSKRLSDYIKCVSNRVLSVDDISSLFFSAQSEKNLYKDVINYFDSYGRFLVQVVDPNTSKRQLTELIVLKDSTDIFTLEKGSLTNTSTELGEFIGNVDEFGNQTIRFIPTDPYNTDSDIKILKSGFNSNIAGINTQSIGFVKLTGSNVVVGVGSTSEIIAVNANTTKSLYANIQILDNVTDEMNFVEMYIDHDGTNTYVSDYYFDSSSNQDFSHNFIGTFTSAISSNILSLSFNNTTSNQITVRSKIVGFGTTSVGIGTYRFKQTNQLDGSERSARLQSNYSVSAGSTTVVSVTSDEITAVKSLVRVSIGQTSSMHQVMLLQDGTNVYTLQYPFLSIGSTSGIGSFGGEYSGSNTILKFYPDAGLSGSFEVESYNEILYSENDYVNISPDLIYGPVTDSISLSAYNAINGSRSNKLNFNLTSNSTPIFAKTFDPSNSSVLDPATGIFTINDHFFSTGEQLIYSAGSSFTGIGSTSVGIGSTLNSVGVVTNRLPSDVYAIKINNNQFRLSTRKDYANAGIYVTFTSYGQGNYHSLEMYKKNEKCIITIDGLIQSPLAYTPINYKLSNNGGSIGVASSIFALSGISSIKPKDILKIDNEFVKVITVGVGTTNVGPISNTGSVNLVQVERGFVGTSASTHTDLTTARVYRGSFNIVKNTIYFTDAPSGKGSTGVNYSNLSEPSSTFSGRVYLRSDYTDNLIFDDISDQFTGIGQTYGISVQGSNPSGIQTGSGLLLINSVFQTPTTSNNTGNNYSLTANAGISSVIFSGITSTNGLIIKSDTDINQNQLPRGGFIISIGSTPGLGYAPLVGASVTAVVGAGGSIVSVGLGSTDILGSGYRGVVSIGVSESGHTGTNASITASIGVGGTLAFTIVNPGSGYTNPTIQIPSPNYENLPIIGVSRLGIGTTTSCGSGLLLNVDVGASSTTGIGSTLFEVTGFKISRPGYGFKVGDVFKPVGLVTDRKLPSLINEFQLTVLDTFNDAFSAWQFGELDYIDSIKFLQNGTRTRFPLNYNGQLLSFETDPLNPDSSNIDLNTVLLIFVNGVIQEPNIAYQFEGGTSFTFTAPPKQEDNVSIFFYRGTRNVDSFTVNVNESIKPGDTIQIYSNNSYPTTLTQDPRRIDNITSSDKIETNLYGGIGIDETTYKPLYWTKQKIDTYINGEYVYKTRDSLESQIYPTARIIGNFNTAASEIFVDNAQFFNYEENESSTTIQDFDALIVQSTDPVAATITANISSGMVQSLNIVNGGSGYSGSTVDVKIAAPKSIGIGIGTTATATVSVVNGSLSTPVTITNPGYGYVVTPQVIAPLPSFKHEQINNVVTVEGFSGIVTGITTTAGISGNPLALKFFINAASFTGLSTSYPIYIFNTQVGKGITSIDSSNTAVVGVGTTYLDNIYKIHSIYSSGSNGEIICNVLSTTSTVGLNTTGSSTNPVGYFSWGRLSGFSRGSSPISIGVTGLTIDSGLSTFPTIQRRGYGLRDTGALRKTLA